MFIAFEGIDGSGKSTQAKMLFEYLHKKGKCIFTHEPTDGATGRFIKELLGGEHSIDQMALQLLFVSDRAEHVNGLILPKIKEGYSVVTDRYMFSSIAYGAASGVDAEWLRKVSGKFPLPDATFVCDVDPEIAVQRIGKRNDKKESVAYFEKLSFLSSARSEFRSMSGLYKNYYVVDSSGTVEEIHSNIIRIVNSL
jgi:dTMP kinase